MDVEEISVEDTYARHQESPIKLIDVRTPEEFAEVRAENAVLMPLDQFNPSELTSVHGLKETDDIYIICRSGARSYTAGVLAMRAGFKSVFNVTGGTIAWEEAHFPVNKG